jgi:hypothetical protein
VFRVQVRRSGFRVPSSEFRFVVRGCARVRVRV